MSLSRPGYVYVGMKRAGSTFLRGYFTEHPCIDWVREGGYFIHDERFDTGEYCPEFKDRGSASKCLIEVNELLSSGLIIHRTGDWDAVRFRVNYFPDDSSITIDPITIAERVKKTLPGARILIVLRNQTDWLRTHYRNFMSQLPQGQRKFADFMTTPEGRLVLNAGQYHVILQGYFDLFGRENVYVALFEDIVNRESETLDSLCGFLKVPFAPYTKREGQYNKGPTNADVRLQLLASKVGIEPAQLEGVKRHLKSIRSLIPDALVDSDILKDEDKTYIRAFFAISNRRTSRLVKRDLSALGYPV